MWRRGSKQVTCHLGNKQQGADERVLPLARHLRPQFDYLLLTLTPCHDDLNHVSRPVKNAKMQNIRKVEGQNAVGADPRHDP